MRRRGVDGSISLLIVFYALIAAVIVVMVTDVAAAVAEVKRHGARSVALVGASNGASVVLAAGTQLRPAVAAVASLSPDVNEQPARADARLTAQAAVSRLRVPVLYAVATGDQYISVDVVRALYARTASPERQLVVAPAVDGHGWDLVAVPGSAVDVRVRQLLGRTSSPGG